MRQPVNEFIRKRFLACFFDEIQLLCIIGVFPLRAEEAKSNVVEYRIIEKKRFL